MSIYKKHNIEPAINSMPVPDKLRREYLDVQLKIEKLNKKLNEKMISFMWSLEKTELEIFSLISDHCWKEKGNLDSIYSQIEELSKRIAEAERKVAGELESNI